MWLQLYEWIGLFIKWFHVICGIAWIGASFYFTWLDNSLETPPKWKKDKGIKGDLWAVHGGGFYEVAKYQVGPEQMPGKLHWFKWEAYTTWITGTALLVWLYYFNAQAYLIDPRVMALSSGQAIALGVLGVALGVLAYELLLRSPLSRTQWGLPIGLMLFGLLFFYGFCHLFSGRGAFIHMGVLIGSIMVNNVWLKIIPGQRKMVAQVAANQAVDPAPGLEGKRRSIHNNYLTLPILFLMISNHYPMVYQHEMNWLLGMGIMVISAWIRHYFNLKHSGKHQPGVLVSGLALMLALAVWVSWSQVRSSAAQKTVPVTPAPVASHSHQQADNPNLDTEQVHQQQVTEIIGQRCVSCHSQTPTDDLFKVAPGGAIFDTWEDIKRWTPRIIARTVDSADMPFLNKTAMTEQERAQLKALLQN